MKSFRCGSSKWWSTCRWRRVGWRCCTGPQDSTICSAIWNRHRHICRLLQPTHALNLEPEISQKSVLTVNYTGIHLKSFFLKFCLQSFTDMVMLRTAFIQYELHPLLCKQTATMYVTALLEFTVKWVYISLQTWLRKAAPQPSLSSQIWGVFFAVFHPFCFARQTHFLSLSKTDAGGASISLSALRNT